MPKVYGGQTGWLNALAAVCVLALLSARALAEAPMPDSTATPFDSPTPEIPTATATLVLRPATTATPRPTAQATATALPLALGGRTITERHAGEFVNSELALLTFHASQDMQHYFYLNADSSSVSVVWDGQPGKSYPQVDTLTVRFSED